MDTTDASKRGLLSYPLSRYINSKLFCSVGHIDLIVTEDCNGCCEYCFVEGKKPRSMDAPTECAKLAAAGGAIGMGQKRSGNGEVLSGDRSSQDTARQSPNTNAAKTPPAQSQTSAASRASRTSRADARYQELLAQAREIMANPEFMEEVMALVRLRMKLEAEISGGKEGALFSILARSFGRRRE